MPNSESPLAASGAPSRAFKCVVHYNPADLQIMHYNTNAAEDMVSGIYAAKTGYTFAILDGALVSKLLGMKRNCKVVLTDGVITDFVASVNPRQPAVSEEESLEDQIAALKARIDTLESA